MKKGGTPGEVLAVHLCRCTHKKLSLAVARRLNSNALSRNLVQQSSER